MGVVEAVIAGFGRRSAFEKIIAFFVAVMFVAVMIVPVMFVTVMFVTVIFGTVVATFIGAAIVTLPNLPGMFRGLFPVILNHKLVFTVGLVGGVGETFTLATYG